MLRLRSVVTMMLLGGAVCAHAAPRETGTAVSIRIHDYSSIDERQLQEAERQVQDAYARIGVRIEWRPVLRPAEAEGGRAAWPAGLTAVTVVVLTPEMAARMHVPAGVAGYAPVSREHGGRIAFVLGARTKAIADEGDVEQSSVLAGVMTHELAHLLMPARAHSADGMMRARWKPELFGRLDRQRFTAAEADAIRRSVRALGGDSLLVAD